MSFYNYGGYPAYVSVAQRKAKADKAIAAAKKKGTNYAPIAAFKGAPGKTFWGKAWCTNLASYSDYENRLPRGASYVRNGAVIDLQIDGGTVDAIVVGSSTYTVWVKVTPVNVMQWKAISRDCSGSIDSLVELLQGKLSTAVMQRICAKQTGLFPDPRELRFDCSCPDGARMCKHVAAVLYGVGMRLDAKPELIFSLRGVDAKDLVSQATVSNTKTVAADKVLDNDLMGDLFGLEMVADVPEKVAAPAQVKVKKLAKPVATAKAKAVTKAKAKAAVPTAAVANTTKTKPATSKSKPIAIKTKKRTAPVIAPPPEQAIKPPIKQPIKPLRAKTAAAPKTKVAATKPVTVKATKTTKAKAKKPKVAVRETKSTP